MPPKSRKSGPSIDAIPTNFKRYWLEVLLVADLEKVKPCIDFNALHLHLGNTNRNSTTDVWSRMKSYLTKNKLNTTTLPFTATKSRSSSRSQPSVISPATPPSTGKRTRGEGEGGGGGDETVTQSKRQRISKRVQEMVRVGREKRRVIFSDDEGVGREKEVVCLDSDNEDGAEGGKGEREGNGGSGGSDFVVSLDVYVNNTSSLTVEDEEEEGEDQHDVFSGGGSGNVFEKRNSKWSMEDRVKVKNEYEPLERFELGEDVEFGDWGDEVEERYEVEEGGEEEEMETGMETGNDGEGIEIEEVTRDMERGRRGETVMPEVEEA